MKASPEFNLEEFNVDTRIINNNHDCGYKEGALPSCAPLAVGFVPRQQSSTPRYEGEKALYRGTLFPGLDLPLWNIVNTDAADVPARELMALDFAAHDLALYLDTHPNDQEAFTVYKELLKLAEEGKRRYVACYGPVMKSDMVDSDCFTWLNDPWPWDNQTEG